MYEQGTLFPDDEPTEPPDRKKEKWCGQCGSMKPRTSFHQRRGSGDRLQPYCKACRAKWSARRLRRYRDLIIIGGERCWICEHPRGNGKFGGLRVDHLGVHHGGGIDGRVRGLLCNRCNRGIAALHEDPDRLEKAARYVREELPNQLRLRGAA